MLFPELLGVLGGPLNFLEVGSWSEMPAAAHVEERVHPTGNSSLPSETCSSEGTDHILKRRVSPWAASQTTSLDQMAFGGLKLSKMNFTVSHFLLIACHWNPVILPNPPRLVSLHLSTSSPGFGYFLMPAFSRFSHRGLQETRCIMWSGQSLTVCDSLCRKEQGKEKPFANQNNCSEGHDNVWQWSPVWILTFTLPVKAHKAFGERGRHWLAFHSSAGCPRSYSSSLASDLKGL